MFNIQYLVILSNIREVLKFMFYNYYSFFIYTDINFMDSIFNSLCFLFNSTLKIEWKYILKIEYNLLII